MNSIPVELARRCKADKRSSAEAAFNDFVRLGDRHTAEAICTVRMNIVALPITHDRSSSVASARPLLGAVS